MWMACFRKVILELLTNDHCLSAKPERVEAFFFSVKKADDLELAVEKSPPSIARSGNGNRLHQLDE